MSVLGCLDPDKEVHIYGAGFSGLVLAYELKKAGFKVKVFEKENRTGGKIQTELTPYGIIEKAANAIYTNDEVHRFLEEIELQSLPANKKLNRFIFRKGQFKKFPLSFKETLKILFRLFKKIPDEAKKESATVYDFFSPLLGKEVTEQVLSAGLFGIFAENSKVLHFHSLFKGAKTSGSYLSFLLDYNKRKKQETKVYGPSHSISFSRGMSEIIEKLTKKLHNDLYLNANERLDYTQNIVICTDAFQASELLKGYLNEVSMLLKEVPYTHIQTSTVFLEEEIDQLENSFGVLFTPESKFQSLGLVNNKAIFDRELSSDNSSYTFISKNSKWEEDLTKLKNSPKIIEAQTKTWTRGLPIYNYERYLLMSRVKERLPKRRVVLFGNYTGDISLRGLITEARKFSNSFNPKTVI